MNEKIQQSVRQLQQLTGLPLQIREDDVTDPEDTLQKLQALCRNMRTAAHKGYVIKRWLTGDLPDDEFFLFSEKLHLDFSGKRAVYLIRFRKEIYPEITMVLRSMFPDERTWILAFDRSQILVVCHFPEHSRPDTKNIAYRILDILNTELMEQVTISFCGPSGQREQLPALCRQCVLSMNVGGIFYPDRTIYDYTELGIGRVLYDSSEEAREDYIRNHIGDRFLTEDSPAFGTDIQNTASCFLANDMNIAETARQLHIHRNTLLYRLEQIQNETGLDIRRFEQAMTYRICSLILLYLK